MRVFISLLLCITAFVFLRAATFAQVPIATHITIVKAEDARRYDKTIEDFLKDPNAAVRARAALAAGRIGDAAAVTPLVGLLKDSSITVRETAAFAIGEIESISAAEAVVAAITANAPQNNLFTALLVEAAGKIAGANADKPGTEQLRTAITRVLSEEQTKGVQLNRQTALHGLTALMRAAPRDAKRARPDETDLLVARFLTNRDPRIRADAGNVLARLRVKNANDTARKMVATDVDPIARANAVRILGAAEDKEAVDLLIKTATSDTDSRVRVSAVRALAALKDSKAAEPLLVRGEALFAAYLMAKRPDLIPAEQNELIEIATALGRLLTNTRNERAVNLLREIGKVDRGNTPEFYIARLRIAPGRGDRDAPELTTWRQFSTLGQLIGEFATLEPTNEEGKTMKAEAPDVLRPLAKAYAEADPEKDADTILAAPEVLRAYAKFKPADLAEVLRTALANKNLFIRATAAELIAELPASNENFTALNRSFEYALLNDARYNDAQLGTLDAMFKLDKRKTLPAIELAIGSLDHLVRAKALDLLKDDEFKNKDTLGPILKNHDMNHVRRVRPYQKGFTKLGQVLNLDADYRRALTRKNGTVRAVMMTQKGEFTIELLPEDAPMTVDNFIKLARANYFNGLEVHRVVPNFVMQDGDPLGDGNGGPGWSIRCELNMVPYERGAVGMALSGKDTGGSQWFVTHSAQPHLDGGYTVFGRVNETGMKIVDRIVRGDKILSARIVEGSSPQRALRGK